MTKMEPPVLNQVSKDKIEVKGVKHFGAYEMAILTMTLLSILLKCVMYDDT